jgi:hypothetical protein
LKTADLEPAIDPAAFGFHSTDELEISEAVIGQDRALKALEFGLVHPGRIGIP